MKKIATVLFVLALVLGPGAITPVPASAGTTTWYVAEGGFGDETGVSWAEAFAHIQEAVDAAQPGDTIEVAAGSYAAFSVLGKRNISIVGAAGAVVTGGEWVSIDCGPIGDAWSMAAVKDSQNIIIRGIAFEGATLSEIEAYREVVVGIAYVDSTGTIADLSVENAMGAELGVGVAVIGHAGTSVVNLVGVTVRNSMAGIIVWDAEADLDGCTITGMRPNGGFGIMDRGVGIVVGIPGADWHGPSTVRLKGSTVSGNNDIGIYVCDSSVVEAHFNNIVGNAELGVLKDGGQTVDARYNWWGHLNGPFLPEANPVSDGVDVWPWAGSHVVTETVTNDIVDARADADTEVKVIGTARVTITRYLSDPGAEVALQFSLEGEDVYPCLPDADQIIEGELTATATAADAPYPLGKWIDVYVPDVSEVEELEIRLYYTADELGDLSAYENYLRLFWWDGTEWVQCSDSGVNTSAGYIWARITSETTPYLADLERTPFGGYGSPPTVPRPCGCFIAAAAYGTETAAEIVILTEFRDAVLLPNGPGSGLVSLYYRTSPPVATLISRCEVLRTTVRVGLIAPIAALLHRSRDMWLPGACEGMGGT